MFMTLAVRFFCIIESSICVPIVLGSIATDTPVPNTPVDDAPTHPVTINKENKINILVSFIF